MQPLPRVPLRVDCGLRPEADPAAGHVPALSGGRHDPPPVQVYPDEERAAGGQRPHPGGHHLRGRDSAARVHADGRGVLLRLPPGK